MTLDKLIQSIARQVFDAKGVALDPDKDKVAIMNALEIGLSKFDRLRQWTNTIIDFEEVVSSTDSYFETTGYDVFKLISIKLVSSGGTEYPLTKMELTDYADLESAFGNNTNSAPANFAIGNKRILVGPKLESDMTAIGRAQRRLTMADLPSLPPDMLIEFAVQLLSKKDSREFIISRADFKDTKAEVEQKEADTAFTRSSRPPDMQIVENQEYIKDRERY